MISVMLDIETLGTSPDSVITQIGACTFQRETGKIYSEFLFNIDITSSLKEGFGIDGSTIAWWFEQPEHTFLSKDIQTGDVRDVLMALNEYLRDAEDIWCHATFDFPTVVYAMKKVGIVPSFHYTKARDIRTLDDLSKSPRIQTSTEKTHNALDDCKHQVEYCVAYFKEIDAKKGS